MLTRKPALQKKTVIYIPPFITRQNDQQRHQREIEKYCEGVKLSNCVLCIDTLSNRPNLKNLIGALEFGGIETIVVRELYDLHTSTAKLLGLMDSLIRYEVNLISVLDHINLKTAEGVGIIHFNKALRRFLQKIRNGSVRKSLSHLKKKGLPLGRPQHANSQLITELLSKGISFRQIASIANCSISAVQTQSNKMKNEDLVTPSAYARNLRK